MIVPEHYESSPLLESLLGNAISNQVALKREYRRGKAIGKSRGSSTFRAEGFNRGAGEGFVRGREYGLRKGALDVWSNEHPDFKASQAKLVIGNEGNAFTFSNIAEETKSEKSNLTKEMKRVFPKDDVKNASKRKNLYDYNIRHGEDFASSDKKKMFKVFERNTDFDFEEVKRASGYDNYFSFTDTPKTITNAYDSTIKIPYKDLDKPYKNQYNKQEKIKAIQSFSPQGSPMKALPAPILPNIPVSMSQIPVSPSKNSTPKKKNTPQKRKTVHLRSDSK